MDAELLDVGKLVTLSLTAGQPLGADSEQVRVAVAASAEAADIAAAAEAAVAAAEREAVEVAASTVSEDTLPLNERYTLTRYSSLANRETALREALKRGDLERANALMALFAGPSPQMIIAKEMTCGPNGAKSVVEPLSYPSGSAFLTKDIPDTLEMECNDASAVTASGEEGQVAGKVASLATAGIAAEEAASAVASAVLAATAVGARRHNKISQKKRDGSGQQVRVGQRVEVRDERDEEWEPGVVSSVECFPDPDNPDHVVQRVFVTKDGWDKAYEWDVCRIEVQDSSGSDDEDEEEYDRSEEQEQQDRGIFSIFSWGITAKEVRAHRKLPEATTRDDFVKAAPPLHRAAAKEGDKQPEILKTSPFLDAVSSLEDARRHTQLLCDAENIDSLQSRFDESFAMNDKLDWYDGGNQIRKSSLSSDTEADSLLATVQGLAALSAKAESAAAAASALLASSSAEIGGKVSIDEKRENEQFENTGIEKAMELVEVACEDDSASVQWMPARVYATRVESVFGKEDKTTLIDQSIYTLGLLAPFNNRSGADDERFDVPEEYVRYIPERAKAPIRRLCHSSGHALVEIGDQYSVWHAPSTNWRLGTITQVNAIAQTVHVIFEDIEESQVEEEKEPQHEIPLAYLSLCSEHKEPPAPNVIDRNEKSESAEITISDCAAEVSSTSEFAGGSQLGDKEGYEIEKEGALSSDSSIELKSMEDDLRHQQECKKGGVGAIKNSNCEMAPVMLNLSSQPLHRDGDILVDAELLSWLRESAQNRDSQMKPKSIDPTPTQPAIAPSLNTKASGEHEASP